MPRVSELMHDSPHTEMIRFWCDTYQQRTGSKYPFAGGKDGATIKWLRSIYTDEEIRSYMTVFFEMDDDFIQQSGFALGVFRGCLPKVIRAASAPLTTDAHGHVPSCRSYADCIGRVIREGRAQKLRAV